MKKLILVLACLMAAISYAQDAEAEIALDVKMTEVFKDKKRFTNLAFSTTDNQGGVIIGRRYKKGYFIEHYDKDIKLVKSYDFEVEKWRGAISKAFISGTKLCLIESFYNKKEKKYEYFTNMSPLDKFSFKRALLFDVSFEDLGENKGFLFFGVSGRYGSLDGGSIKLSENQKYLAFSLDLNGEKSETHRLFVFNNELEEVYRTEFKRDIADRRFALENIDIDESDGTIYLLGKAYTREKKKKKDGGKYQFELYKILKDSRQSLVFDSSEKYIGSLTTVINKGKLFCVGFYSGKKDHRYKGLAYFDIEHSNMSLIKATYSPFTEQFVFDKYGKSKDKELRNISYRSIFVNAKNECIVNAEEYVMRTRYVTTPNGGSRLEYTFHFGDIVSAKIGADGKLVWARNINKRTAAKYYSPYLSYTSTYHNDKTYFFLNCSDKVRKLRNDRLEFKGVSQKKSNFYVITLDENGNFEYKKVLDDKDSEVPFALGAGIMSNNGKDIIFQGRRGSKKQILKVTL